MKFPFLLLILAVPAVASCAFEVGAPVHEVMMETSEPGEPLYVTETPPAPREDVVIGVAPEPDYVWVGGYWTWSGIGWRWLPGCWTRRPRPGVVWVPGRWDPRPRGQVWISGQWR